MRISPAVEKMCSLLRENREGLHRGIYSVCSANHLVIEAAFSQAALDQSPLLIEATSNQVNQDGGYTGMTPAQFRDYVTQIASRQHFPLEQLILGGDHLGPNPWRKQSAEAAMEKACAMIAAYAKAGFGKLHLDASMPCADDRLPLTTETIAKRAAKLCATAEAAVIGSEFRPVYIIGSEVPTPGGAIEELEHIAVTTTESVRETLSVHENVFRERGLLSAWERVVGIVVQPGVEFGDDAVIEFLPDKASDLAAFIAQQKQIVYEAHSTDYQTAKSLQALIEKHFGILKVGPELTYVMREAVFGLARIEEELISESRRSFIRQVLERAMMENADDWKPYYHGDEVELRLARAYSYSDRIRYYWPNTEVSLALARLIDNLRSKPAPLPLISQYLPRQADAIRYGLIQNQPRAIIHHRIRESFSRYAQACNLSMANARARHH